MADKNEKFPQKNRTFSQNFQKKNKFATQNWKIFAKKTKKFLTKSNFFIQDYSGNTIENGDGIDLSISGSRVTPEQISQIEAIYENNKDNINKLSLIDEKSWIKYFSMYNVPLSKLDKKFVLIENLKFCSKIQILIEKKNFGRKFKILVENRNFVRKSKSWSKIKMLVENQNFRQKSKF